MKLISGFCMLLAVTLMATLAAAQDEKSNAPSVTVAQVQSQTTGNRGRYVGRIQAVSTVELQARVEGFLEKRNFKEGGFVKKGTLLYVIERGLYEASVASSKAQLEGAQATLKNSQLDLERQKILVSKGDVAQSVLDSAQATVGANQASVGEAQSSLDTANINLGYTEIYAPIDGRISKSLIDVGNLVDANSGTLATITSVDPIEVSFYMGEKDLIEDREKGLISDDSAALTIKLVMADGKPYDKAGSVTYIGTQVEQASDTIELHATFANPDNILIPGQFVNVIVEDSDPKATLVVPQSAVQLDGKGHFVYVVDAQNKIERRDLKLGRQAGSVWEVASGLEEGDKVVVQGLQRVHPGITVDPVEAKSAANG